MSLPAGIIQSNLTEWENGHQNFKTNLTAGASFDMRLPLDFRDPTTLFDNYRATTGNFKWLIQHAIDNQWRLKALGNGWSLSELVKNADGLVNTRELRLSFFVGNNMVDPDYTSHGGAPENLFFSQCGNSIEIINRHLEERGRSLKASGASNQQTIVGATSTGTHGAAYKVGAVHDSIVGLHLVCGPDKDFWIERESYPVVSQAFASRLGTTITRNDDLFNAVVVSFGSFGFIHGVMLETEPKFLLDKRTAADIPYDDALRLAINDWDFTGIEPSLPLPVNGPHHSLYHFEMVVNPFEFEENNPAKGAYMKVMYKKPWDPTHLPHVAPHPKFVYGDELLGVMQTVLDHLGDDLKQILVRPLVTRLFPLAFNSSEEVTGTIGEIFNNTKFRGKAASAAIGIDTQNASKVLDEFIALTRQEAFAGGVALRFVKGTKALLGFTQFEKTCVMEMDGVDSGSNRVFFEKMWHRLEALGIRYTTHWGKINFNLNPALVRQMYGDTHVDTWIASRHQLLDTHTRQVFNTDFLTQCGLDV